MENITYVGEWTLASNLGQAMIAMGFVAALLGFIGYLKGSLGDGDAGWLKFGRRAFIVHGVLFFAVIALIFALIANHRYEFQYVWKHLNNAMPMRYIFSCFWGGQEGGFLLWMFWHIVLGFLLIRKKGKWEGPVMTIFSAVQASLACMLLGVYFGDYQIGLDPFQLLRNEPDNIGLPWTKNADYLTAFKQFQDGRGLNPLLQNYWMTIHPPTLFLGFASTLVPFAFAIAGLWKRDFTGWIKQALPWTFFGVMILGTGILMGGAWAYEALSFGGFWAWDPVENSSLVPWIVLVAGAHLMLINNRKPTALFSMFLLLTLSFVLVVYSTFLTKSGILGDSSVHSFVDSGILPQLLIYLLLFVGVMSAMFNKNIKQRFMYAAANLILLVVGCFW
ncbi:MAG: cytochrome c biogenesis protein CcsA, partial [Flavobacteriales bacterium]|nr:cytochrome c biogenesis protein CcsA [Flavobacteriales bacterium]